MCNPWKKNSNIFLSGFSIWLGYVLTALKYICQENQVNLKLWFVSTDFYVVILGIFFLKYAIIVFPFLRLAYSVIIHPCLEYRLHVIFDVWNTS